MHHASPYSRERSLILRVKNTRFHQLKRGREPNIACWLGLRAWKSLNLAGGYYLQLHWREKKCLKTTRKERRFLRVEEVYRGRDRENKCLVFHVNFACVKRYCKYVHYTIGCMAKFPLFSC